MKSDKHVDPWRMITWGGGAEQTAHLLVPGLVSRDGRTAYMRVACGRTWLLRSVRKLVEPTPDDVKCEACLASKEAAALGAQHD